MLQGKVLLTGASGFIGGQLREALLEAGVDVVAIRREGSPPAKRGRSVTGDYSSLQSMKAILEAERPDYVVHLAGATNGVTYEDFTRANVMPTQNLLDALAAVHPEVKRFVHVSSLAAYGPSTIETPLRETDPRRPIEHYGKSKLEAEKVVEAASVPWTIVRPSGVYGPGDYEFFQLFQLARFGINLFYGNRYRWFSLVYVDDCIRAITEAATSDAAVGKGYFLADGVPLTWDDMQREILRAMERRAITVDVPGKLVDVAALGGELLAKLDGKPRLLNKQKALMGAQDAWTCSSDAAREDFGWEAEVDVREGVRRAHEWYRQQGWYRLRR